MCPMRVQHARAHRQVDRAQAVCDRNGRLLLTHTVAAVDAARTRMACEHQKVLRERFAKLPINQANGVAFYQ